MTPRIDTDKLSSLLADLSLLTGMRIVVFDASLNKLCSCPEEECGLCAALKRVPSAERLCRSCDEEACRKCLALGRLQVYECHAGLFEAVMPLRFNGITLGYMMLGQLMSREDYDARLPVLTEYVSRFVESPELLISRLTVKTREEIHAAAHLLEVCASYLLVRELISVDDGGLAFRLSEYIGAHLSDKLTVERLCAELSVSRNRLYRLSRECFGMSIAAYIRGRRIDEATLLMRRGFTVAEAASAVGIDDYNYFSKLYKRETGCLAGSVKRRES